MDQQTAWREVLDFATKPIVVEPVSASLSIDAGLLPLRQLDEALGFTEQFAAALTDDRGGGRLTHSFLEMTRSRIYGILAGYEDCNDHDALRHDAVFKLLAGRMPDDADRLSCHRFMANCFRLYLHCAAANLLVRLRQVVANPPDALLPTDSAGAQVANQPEPEPLPADQLGGSDRKRYFHRRRQADPLGEGQPNTWRMLLFKVAAEVVVSTRRVRVRLSGAWPYLNFYCHVCEAVSHRFRGGLASKKTSNNAQKANSRGRVSGLG